MKLPNGDRAIVEIDKLKTYILNPFHPLGKHKARVFSAALELELADAPTLESELRRAAREGEATEEGQDEFGQRYSVDFTMEHRGRRATIRSGWIVRRGETAPRLTTAFVL